MNKDANPVPVKILGQVPLIPVPLMPYQSTQSAATCSGGPFLTNCEYTFPVVANLQRLVITNFSYSGLASNNPYKLALTNGQVSPTLVHPTFTSTVQSFSGGVFSVVNSNQPVLLYVDSGGQPKLTVSMVGGGNTVTSSSATISGYLINCAVAAGCPATAP